MRPSTLRSLATAGALALVLTSCGSDDAGDTGNGSAGAGGSDLELINAGELTVCSDIPYKPFEWQEGGEYVGFDMDLMREIADGLGLELVVKDSSFDGLQSGLSLNSGQCDVVASAMTITEEREENLDYSDPYIDSRQSLLVPEGSDIASIADLGGKKVGVQQGTTGARYAQENAPEDAQILSFPSDGEMFPAIKAGQVDALLQDFPVNYVHTEEGDFKIVEDYATDEAYGFAVKEEGAENLLAGINEQLQRLRDDGTYDKIFQTYFTTE